MQTYQGSLLASRMWTELNRRLQSLEEEHMGYDPYNHVGSYA